MNESIPELQEEFAEIIPTVQEGTIIAGVQSINGKAGDLDLKTINNTDLLTAGNLNLATSAQLSDLEAVVEGKQDQLSDTQLAAVNSGIDSTKVAQITTNKNSITTINGKIPAQASSTNKLADKNFVNSSIATNTANYISNNGQPFTSVAQLEAYTGTVTNNDYAFVTGTDSAGNTYYDRYKATVVGSTVTWAKEYRLNNSSFTSDQWTAINSGATTGLIEQITTNQNDIATLQTDKQDKLVAGTNIQIASDGKTISATDTKYTAGTGLTLTGTQFSVTEPVPAGFFTDTASTQEGEGTRFTLNNTTNAPIDGVILKGDTFQQTYSGKNLLPCLNGSVTVNGITATIADGVLTLNGTSSGVGIIKLTNGLVTNAGTSTPQASWLAETMSISNLQGHTISLSYESGTPTTNSCAFRIYTSSTAYINQWYPSTSNQTYTWAGQTIAPSCLCFFFNSGLTFTNYKVAVQIENGTSATSFEKFVGGLPSPNPSYPQDIQVVTGSQTVSVVGKNLFLIEDGSITNNGVVYVKSGGEVSLTGAATANSSLTLASTFFNAKANTTYTLSANNPVANSGVRLRLRTSSGTISSFQLTTANASVQWAPTEDIGVKPEIYLPNGTSIGTTPFIVKPMLELGSTATAYQPYESQSYTIDLGTIELCKLGTYQDYIYKDGVDWKVHKTMDKVTLDGTENWVQLVASGFNNYYLESMATNLYLGDTATYLSNYFTGIPTNDRYSDGTFFINNSGRGVFTYNAITSKDDFKTWLTTHNTGVYYVLATATDTVITDAALIAQLEALAGSTTYAPQTNYATAGTGTNLPVILTVDVFKNNYAGLLARLEKAGA